MTIEWLKSLWRDNRHLRRLLLVIDVGLIIFWVYSIYYVINQASEPHSDGFEILEIIPTTVITLCLSLPALLLLIWNRTLRTGAFVTVAAVIMNVWCWSFVLFVREAHCVTFKDFCIIPY